MIQKVKWKITSMHDLKVITAGNSTVYFFNHPVNKNRDERTLHETSTDLIRKFKAMECEEKSV